jgi:hypothetical protein
MLENFFNETATLGATTKPGKAKKAKYQGQTVTDMRNDMVERAQATIDALEGYERGALRAPMARSVRNGIKVKIGYGKRNVGFFEDKEDKDTKPVAIVSDRYFARSEAFIAAAYLRKIINLVNAGEFDELLTQALAKMALRFTRDSKNNVYQFAAE